MANESIASPFLALPNILRLSERQSVSSFLGKNLLLQDDLYKLRADTQEAFDEAKSLLARQKDLDREQRELHQVRRRLLCPADHHS